MIKPIMKIAQKNRNPNKLQIKKISDFCDITKNSIAIATIAITIKINKPTLPIDTIVFAIGDTKMYE